MPDVWESEHGLNPNIADASADADGDGQSNLREFLAGTDPQSANSRFVARIERLANSVRLTFNAVAGRTYSIHQRDTFSSGSWDFVTTVPPQIGDHTEQVTIAAPAGSGPKFFRISTPPQP